MDINCLFIRIEIKEEKEKILGLITVNILFT